MREKKLHKKKGDGRIEGGKEKERMKKKYLNVGKKGGRVHVPLTDYIVRR